ncbi:hypothetical protein J7K74_02225 [Candidatus Woesearchaeota archaeon]|nr:hypothetical protein [Candidatus Woesearchaeota archaeon]
MHREIILKNPGEKLVKIELDIEDKKITNVCISGDFFFYPEGSMKDLESAILGPIRNVCERIREFFMVNNIEMLGISEDTIIMGIEGALKEKHEEQR